MFLRHHHMLLHLSTIDKMLYKMILRPQKCKKINEMVSVFYYDLTIFRIYREVSVYNLQDIMII